MKRTSLLLALFLGAGCVGLSNAAEISSVPMLAAVTSDIAAPAVRATDGPAAQPATVVCVNGEHLAGMIPATKDLDCHALTC
jgi:hypothetical protein